MTKATRRGADGQEMDEEFWQRAEEKAEAGLDASRLRRRAGRPTLGEEPAGLTAVRLPRHMRERLDERASRDHATTSEVIRRALEQYLAS